jgi:hypothetical protein
MSQACSTGTGATPRLTPNARQMACPRVGDGREHVFRAVFTQRHSGEIAAYSVAATS